MSETLNPTPNTSPDEQQLCAESMLDDALREYHEFVLDKRKHFYYLFVLSHPLHRAVHDSFHDELRIIELQQEADGDTTYQTHNGTILRAHVLSRDELQNPEVIAYFAGELSDSAQAAAQWVLPAAEA